ncbi:MAG: metallophosphoesterase [Bacilli bacterium]|nr:metallophosphoesterase [Bacilli bacterium]
MKKILFLLSIIVFLYSQNFLLTVSNYKIINSKIPESFNNYKIVQISDYHNETNKLLNNKLIKKIKDIKPNIIVITGDLIDSTNTNIDQVIKLVDGIKNISDIYYVTGNHETWTNEYEQLKIELEKRKVHILNNEAVKLKSDISEINLIGINDTKTNEEFQINIEQVNYNKNNYTILLSHRPELYNEYVKKDIDLVLTGHAHGGQIRIFNQGLIAPDQGLLPKYTSGLIEENNTTMITSRGIGNSVIPIRINNHPELVVITLKNKN